MEQHYVGPLWLVPLGFFAGAYGTLIGAGGGFVLAPALLLLYPEEPPETITSISLAVVFLTRSRQRWLIRDPEKSLSNPARSLRPQRCPARSRARSRLQPLTAQFNLLFGLILIAVAIFLALNPGKKGAATLTRGAGDGTTGNMLSFSTMLVGALLSTVFGFLSSFLGVGGGFLYVPTLVCLLGFPSKGPPPHRCLS